MRKAKGWRLLALGVGLLLLPGAAAAPGQDGPTISERLAAIEATLDRIEKALAARPIPPRPGEYRPGVSSTGRIDLRVFRGDELGGYVSERGRP